MNNNIKVASILVVLSALALSTSHSYVIPSPMDPIEQCIFTCDHCFQSMKLVQCANECIVTEGSMGKHWLKNCPQLYMPLFVEVEPDRSPKVIQT